MPDAKQAECLRAELHRRSVLPAHVRGLVGALPRYMAPITQARTRARAYTVCMHAFLPRPLRTAAVVCGSPFLCLLQFSTAIAILQTESKVITAAVVPMLCAHDDDAQCAARSAKGEGEALPWELVLEDSLDAIARIPSVRLHRCCAAPGAEGGAGRLHLVQLVSMVFRNKYRSLTSLATDTPDWAGRMVCTRRLAVWRRADGWLAPRRPAS